MFLDKTLFPFTEKLERSWAVVLDELNQIPPDEFVECFISEGYGKGWVLFPLINRLPHQDAGASGLRELCEANQDRCPGTVALLDSIPGLTGGAFSMLKPGCHIYPHSDFDDPRVFRGHLGLHTDPNARFRVGTETQSWEAGKCLFFDGKNEHEAANTGPEARVVLLFDVLQEKYPAAVSGSVA